MVNDGFSIICVYIYIFIIYHIPIEPERRTFQDVSRGKKFKKINVDIKKIKGQIFESSLELRTHMLTNATTAIDTMINDCEELAGAVFINVSQDYDVTEAVVEEKPVAETKTETKEDTQPEEQPDEAKDIESERAQKRIRQLVRQRKDLEY